MGMALNTNGDLAMQQVNFLARGVLPEKLDAAVSQLEAEPAGVGLNPAEMYEGLSHAASAVLSAVSRVAQRAREGFPLHPAYILTPADLYDHEPMALATPAELLALGQPPDGLCFAHLEGDGHFLVHYGTLAFSMYGRCLVASRDAPDTPTRRFLADLHGLCALAGLGRAPPLRSAPAAALPAAGVAAAAPPPPPAAAAGPPPPLAAAGGGAVAAAPPPPPPAAAGRGRGRGAPLPVPVGVPLPPAALAPPIQAFVPAPPAAFMENLVSAASLRLWLEATAPPYFLALRNVVGFGSDAREQAVRDLHLLRFGTEDQKLVLVASLACRAPIRPRLSNLFSMLPAAGAPGAMAGYLGRLCRAAGVPGLKSAADLSALFTLDGALKDAVRSLTAPGLVVATVDDRLARVEEFFASNSHRPSAAGGGGGLPPRSAYSNDLGILVSQPAWRAVEAALVAELGARRRPLVLFETLMSSPVLGARQLALGRPATEELKRLLRLSEPLQRAVDILNNGSPSSTAISPARHKLVADAFVAERVLGTFEPATDAEINFHTQVPPSMTSAILRGAFDEIDFVQFLRLLLAAQKPNRAIAPYADAWFDPHFVPLLVPHLERMSALLGLPSTLTPGSIPVPLPPVFGTLSSIATTIARQYADIMGVPSAFSSENLQSLSRFSSQVLPEAARRFQAYYSCADPAGPLPQSLFEQPSAAVSILSTLQRAIQTQEDMASNQKAFYNLVSEVATFGTLEAFVAAQQGGKRRAPAPPSPSREQPAKKRDKGKGKDPERPPSRGSSDRSSASPTRERAPSPGPLGSRKQAVQYSADGAGFWYQDQSGKRASPVYDYEVLEKLAGKSRHDLDFPVILSSKATAQARATLCCFEGQPGHEHHSSSAHVAPYGDFVAKVHQHFQRPASPRASTSASSRP